MPGVSELFSAIPARMRADFSAFCSKITTLLLLQTETNRIISVFRVAKKCFSGKRHGIALVRVGGSSSWPVILNAFWLPPIIRL